MVPTNFDPDQNYHPYIEYKLLFYRPPAYEVLFPLVHRESMYHHEMQLIESVPSRSQSGPNIDGSYETYPALFENSK